MKHDISIIIPAFNESKNIIFILNKISKTFSQDINLEKKVEIIIVNNGSTDDTDNIIKSNILFKNKVISYLFLNKNIGYGNGILQGIKISKGDCISWTHADNQTDFTDILKIYEKYKNRLSKSDILVKGKRKNRNIFDYFFTLGMSIFVFLITGIFVNDINAQPKVFDRTLYNKFNNAPLDFSLDLYLLLLSKKNNIKIIEYPVFFKKRKFGVAKGGGTLRGKFFLILRTVKYIINIKKYGNNSS